MTTTQPPAARVSGTIKALEWKAAGLRHAKALGFNTTYTIMLLPDGSGARWQSRYMGEWFDAADIDDAKAAAQADYEARILAAIQPDPEPQPVAWRYRSVVKPTCWSNVTEYRRTAYARIGMEEQPLYATPSSAGTVSVEAAARVTLAEIERQFSAVGVKPENMAPEMVLKRLRALAGEGGR